MSTTENLNGAVIASPPQLVVPAGAAAAATTATAASPADNNNNKSRNRSWDENFAALLTYRATHNGSTDVPLTYKADRILGKWVAHTRESQNVAALSQERKDALNAIGFIWNPHEQKWNEMYERLKIYKAKTGHCKVPTNWKADRKLGKWVMRQREKRKNNLLPEDRLRKLEDIGFVWAIYAEAKGRKSNIIDQKWNIRFQELKEYQQQHNHCNVPKDYGALGKWVQEQRVMHQRKLLKQERKKILEDIGFVFSYRAQKCQQDWNQMYELLKACSTTTEDGQFKVLGMDGGLNRWVHRQKEAYRTHRLDPGREVLLNKINFQFPERGPIPTKVVNPPIPGIDAPSKSDHPPQSSESDKLIGIQLAQGIEVISKFMNISPAQLSQRLITVPSASTVTTTPADNDTERKKHASKKTSAASTAANKPSTEINAFGRLLPKIVAMKEYGEETMEEGVRYLEGFVRQEKGWDPRPSDGDIYSRLLSLAAELGVLLNPASERCQSIITSAELQLERVMARMVKALDANREAAKKRKAQDGDDGDSSKGNTNNNRNDNNAEEDDGDGNDEDDEEEQDGNDDDAEKGGDDVFGSEEGGETEGIAPAAKRAKVDEEETSKTMQI